MTSNFTAFALALAIVVGTVRFIRRDRTGTGYNDFPNPDTYVEDLAKGYREAGYQS